MLKRMIDMLAAQYATPLAVHDQRDCTTRDTQLDEYSYTATAVVNQLNILYAAARLIYRTAMQVRNCCQQTHQSLCCHAHTMELA